MEDTLPLASRARAAIVVTWIVIAFSIASLIADVLVAQGTVDLESGNFGLLDIFVTIGYLGFTASFLLSVILVAMWIHRGHARLLAYGADGLEYTPGWAVGWYFVPIANLFKPFGAMKELWSTSLHGEGRVDEGTPGLLSGWWATWIIGNILSNIAMRMEMSSSMSGSAASFWLSAAGTVLTAVCAVLLIRIIAQVTEAQTSGRLSSAVFA